MKAFLQRLEDVFPGYKYYLVAVSTVAFFTPILTPRVLGHQSTILEIGVVLGGAVGFIWLYRSTYARVAREWYNGR